MLKINKLLQILTLFTLLLHCPAYAASVLDRITQWGSGTTSQNQPSTAIFRIGVTADNGNTFATRFDTQQKLDVLADFQPAAEHQGKLAHLYLVAKHNNDWYMKNSKGEWRPWDYQLATLVTNTAEPKVLLALESLIVQAQLSNLAGEFQIFVGYQIDQRIHYNQVPLKFSVTLSEKPVDNVPVVAEPKNSAPLADAGSFKDINEGSQVTLDASNSRDPDGTIVSYHWEQTKGTSANLSNINSAKLSFTAPEVNRAIDLQFKVTVTDNRGAIASSTVDVTVRDVPVVDPQVITEFVPNPVPTCNANQVLSNGVCETPVPVCLGSQVLQGGVCVTPAPVCIAPQVLENGACVTPVPTCTLPQVLQNGSCINPIPTCVAPQVLENGVCVTPVPGCTLPQVLENGVCVSSNTAPIAHAGSNQNVMAESMVTLDGSQSIDNDGSIASYLWEQTSGLTVTINNSTMITPTFTAPKVTQTTDLIFKLTVTDNRGASHAALVTVTVTPIILKTTISGTAFDAPIIGGTVTVTNFSGTVLGTAVTDANGNYTLDVPQSVLSEGYRVEVTGGQMNGQPFTGRMSAVYAANQSHSNANLTPITTLINAIAQDSNGADDLAKRNDALQTLVRLGMIPSADWNLLSSEWFDLLGLSNRISEVGGLDAWIQLIKADLADGELSVEEARSLFPKAHGGLETLSVVSGADISIFPGDQELVYLRTQPNIDANSMVLKLLDAPSWVWVDGDHLRVEPPLATTTGATNVTVEVSNNTLNNGRKLSFSITIMQPVTLLSGSLGPAGGRLENQWKDIILDAPVGALTKAYDLQYLVGVGAQGGIKFKFKSTPEIPTEELFRLSLSQPSENILIANYLQATANTVSARTRNARSASVTSPVPVCDSVPYDDTDGDGFIFDQIYSKTLGYFHTYYDNGLTNGFMKNGIRLPPIPLTMTYPGVPPLCASMLRTSSADPISANTEPVLFVHGFAKGGLSEVDSYFKYFPGLVSKWKPNGKNFKPFTFIWNTNSRFEDSAFELGLAIQKISSLTGKQVHIVAHSFGGALVRTLLQGLSEQPSYVTNNQFIGQEGKTYFEKHVASVTTVGTPHSGIFSYDEEKRDFGHGEKTFYSGIDLGFSISKSHGDVIPFCNAITCYEMGSPGVTFRSSTAIDLIFTPGIINKALLIAANVVPSEVQKNFNLYKVKDQSGQIPYKLVDTFAAHYPNVPTQILIGLIPDKQRCTTRSEPSEVDICRMLYKIDAKTVGDGLISLAGQRLIPSDHAPAFDTHLVASLINIHTNDKNIEEHMLGLNSNAAQFNRGREDFILTNSYLSDLVEWQSDFYSSVCTSRIRGCYSYQFPERTVAYHHESDGGNSNLSSEASIDGSGDFGNLTYRKTPRLSEAALHDCNSKLIDPNTQACNHATWQYFTSMVQMYPAQATPEALKARAYGKWIKNLNIRPNSRVTPRSLSELASVIIHANGMVVGEGLADADGNFNIDVEFKPNTIYIAEIIPPASSGLRATRKQLTTSATIEESSLNFGEIDLFAMLFEQSKIPVQLKDASTGVELFDYNLTLKNENGLVLLTKTVHSTADALISDLPVGAYSVEITKTGYLGIGKQECVANLGLLEPDICAVTMVPQAYVISGGLSAVLTWGDNPRDLDSHLLQYNSADSLLCHVFYGNQICGNDSLDVDDTTSFGPETVKITDLDSTKHYVYAIHHFSGSGAITSTSQAQVKVTFADGSTRNFTAPTSGGMGQGDYWRVFDIVDNKLLPCQQNCLQTAINPRIRSLDSSASDLPWKDDIARDLRPK